jgi:cytochrome c-type biogenesis protein CcmH/NrfF
MREDTIDPKSQQDRSRPNKILIHGTDIPSIFLRSSESGEEEQLMTTLRQIELRCPVCDNEFKSQSVVSTNAFGGKQRWVVDATEQQRLNPRE